MATTTRRRLLVLTCAVGMLTTLALSAPAAASGRAAAPTALPQAVDVIAGTGLASTNESFDSTPVDYDGDGDMDVWVGYHDQGGALFRNDGGSHFTRVATNAWPKKGATGKPIDRHKCVWADVDGNGLVDSFCAVGRGTNNSLKPAGANELWLQAPAGVFTDVAASWGLGDVCGRSHYPAFLHVTPGGLPDLFVGDLTPRPVSGDPCDDPANGLPSELSKLYVNQQGSALVENDALGIGGNGGELCATELDVNGDGLDDLLVCPHTGAQLWINQGDGRGFVDRAAEWGLTGAYKALVPADLDGDGDLDLAAVAGRSVSYLLNTGGHFAKPHVLGTFAKGTYARAVAVGDADGNGSVDIYGLATNGSSGSNPDDAIYLNVGMQFTPIPVPSTTGFGGTVEPLDVDGDGRTEFLVQNGVAAPGPMQLIRVQ